MHSPTPWRWDSSHHFNSLVDATGKSVLEYTIDDDGIHGSSEDEAFIVRAVNNFDALVAACEKLIKADDDGDRHYLRLVEEATAIARAALAQAKE